MSAALYFEDLHVGQSFALGPHALEAAAIIDFAQEFDPQPFHLDEEAAKASVLGGLSASGWHSYALVIRLMCDAVLSRAAVLGSSGMEEVKWLKPVYAGDVLKGELKFTAARVSASRPGIGIVNFVSHLADQRGTVKIEVTGMVFVRRRPA